MHILMVVISVLLVIVAITGQGLKNQVNRINVLAGGLVPESAFYSGVANINTAINMSMETSRLSSVEQALVEVCRATYYMGSINRCMPLNENFTWKFLLQNGATGSLNSILSMASSSSFSCATPEQYGVYLLLSAYGAGSLSEYNYNLNIFNQSTHALQIIGGQADPCAYADIVQ